MKQQNPSTIIKAASMIKKPKKDAIYKFVIEEYKQGNVTEKLATDLLCYFKPSPPKKSKTLYGFVAKAVAKAVAKHDVHSQLKYLHSDGQILCATDGHRLHWIDTELEEGYYDPSSVTKIDVDQKYPDVSRVIPDVKREEDWIFIKLDDFEILNPEDTARFHHVELLNGAWINYQYLLEFADGSKEIEWLSGRKENDSQRFRVMESRIQERYKNGVIMFIRKPEEKKNGKV